MNMNQLTQKTIEALQNAQRLAVEYANQAVEQEHVLAALAQQQDGLIPQLLTKLGADPNAFAQAALQKVEALPRVTGSGRDPDKVYISGDLDRALNAAEEQAKQMKDEYISVEHVFLGILQRPGKAAADGVVPDHVDNSPGGRAEGSIEVLFSVPKKFHKRANRRNLLKRRTREAYRLSREALRRSVREAGVEIDVALVYSVKECQSYRSIAYAVQRILERIRTRI